jgi:cobalt-zinc-cadmium efflux system outer membrane protein
MFDVRCSMLFSLLLIAFTGCARFHPQPLSLEKSAAELESRSLTNAALKTFLEKNLHREFTEWPAAQWNFEMLTYAAFYFHPDLALARAQWHVALAVIKTAGGRPNPTLALVPGYDTTHNPGLSPWFPAVSFDLPIETMGKRGKRIATAEHLSESARLNVATTAWQVRSNLRLALLDFAAAQKHEALLQKQIAIQEEIVSRMEQQVQAGAMASSEVVTFRIALQKLRLDFANAQSQSAEARGHLAEAIGVPVSAVEEMELPGNVAKDSSALTELTSAEARHTALTSRADILGALADYAATQSKLQEEIAKQYPDLHLNPGYQFDQGDNKWSLGLTFELPILNQNQGPIAEAAARREEAAAKFNALQAKVLAEIERAVEVYRVSEKNSATLQSLAEAQAKQRDSVEAQFNAGAVDRVELLGAQIEFLNSELAQVDAQTKLQQAAAQLEDAIQCPFDAKAAIEQSGVAQTKQDKP